ncbi:hypothetical protein ABL78_4343 [Leptomonas seymouri]|uniref:Flagellar attachment zone protein 1 conserved domain-containing protein n=1 Tax=Leptomonas seymouri TaxID=5684 RepID=A0A0N1IKB3_LEPSE|nr:hypothetical protein ABL78_4343 [Leptomonas seymouri]|eukprot:KPI86568.1 hypothetical protein ABL78_4343 [Leptomonas seymouri]
MAHIYLCKPQSQVRLLSPWRRDAYLDEIVQQAGRVSTRQPNTNLTSTTGEDSPSPTCAAHEPPRPLRQHTEQLQCMANSTQMDKTACTAVHRGPSLTSAVVKEDGPHMQPPPPSVEVQPSYRKYGGFAQHGEDERPPLRERTVENIWKMLHVSLQAPVSTAPVADNAAAGAGGELRSYGATAPYAPSTGMNSNERSRSGADQKSPHHAEAPSHTASTSAARGGNANAAAMSSLAFAQRFLIDYEAFSRRDIIIDYYSAFPQPPALPTSVTNVAFSAAATASHLHTAPSVPSPTTAIQKTRVRGSKPKTGSAPTSRWRHCRLVFPGHLWDVVLRHRRQVLQHALISDAEGVLPAASIEVSSLSTSLTELEAILSVKDTNSRRCVNVDAMLTACSFGSVWELYSFVSSLLSHKDSLQHPPPSGAASPPPSSPPLFARNRSRAEAIEPIQEDDTEEGNFHPFRGSPAFHKAPRFGGASWRQTRRQAGRHGDAPQTQSELVVPIVFATTVTSQLRRAARGGASSDLRVALRRDGLYAVPSAKEVQVRATRVNAEGLYVELVFRWPEGEEGEENAEEAMDEAPFTDTWRYLEDCLPHTTATVLSTVVKRGASSSQYTEVGGPPQRQPQLRQACVPHQRPFYRVDAGVATPAGGLPPSSSVSHSAEMPLTSLKFPASSACEARALEAALTADVAPLATETVADVQVMARCPKASVSNSVSIGFKVVAVPEEVGAREQLPSIPQQFPESLRTPPAASTAAASTTPESQPETVGASVPLLSAPAIPGGGMVIGGGGTAEELPSKQKMSQLTRTTPERPVTGSESRASEVFFMAGAGGSCPLNGAATQSSLRASLPASKPVPAPASTSSDGASSAVAQLPTVATDPMQQLHALVSFLKTASAAIPAAPLPVPFAFGETSLHPLKESVEVQASRREPSEAEKLFDVERAADTRSGANFIDGLEERWQSAPASTHSGGGKEAESVAAAAAKTTMRSDTQRIQTADAPLNSFQTVEVLPSVTALSNAEQQDASHGHRPLSFSMNKRDHNRLADLPVLQKNALQGDVQDLSYSDEMQVMGQGDPNVPLKTGSVVSTSASTTGSCTDVALPVELKQHVWDAQDLQSQHHLPPAAQSSTLTSAFTTLKPKEALILRRLTNDDTAVLDSSLKPVRLTTLESLSSNLSSRELSSTADSTSSRASAFYQLQVPGTIWSNLLTHHREEVAVAVMADVETLLADPPSELSIGALTVQEDGGLQVDFQVRRTSLPFDLNPPLFRKALDRLPLTHLHHLHDTATSEVPTTVQIRRFFSVPELTEDIFHQEEETIRSLYVAETCALLDTAAENLLWLTFSGHLIADVLIRLPKMTDATLWRKALAEYNYPGLTDFLTHITSGESSPDLQSTDVMRRVELLPSNSLTVTSLEKDSAAASATTPIASADSNFNSSFRDESISVHTVCLHGPLWPTLMERHAEELHKAVMSDSTSVLSPLFVSVEKQMLAVNDCGVILTFFVRGSVPSSSASRQEAENALQNCPFTNVRALYKRVQIELDDRVNVVTLPASTYMVQLGGEAWLEVLEKHKKEISDTFALEALTCLRGSDAINVPVSVFVREVVPNSAGVTLRYCVVSNAVASAVDGLPIAEVLGKYPFPLLWELYDTVIISLDPPTHTVKPHRTEMRSRRLLNVADNTAVELPNLGSCSMNVNTDEMDQGSNLQHLHSDALVGDGAAAAPPSAKSVSQPSAVSLYVEKTAEQGGDDFSHPLAPASLQSSSTAAAAPKSMQLVAHGVSSSTPPPQTSVSRQLEVNEEATKPNSPSTVLLRHSPLQFVQPASSRTSDEPRQPQPLSRQSVERYREGERHRAHRSSREQQQRQAERDAPAGVTQRLALRRDANSVMKALVGRAHGRDQINELHEDNSAAAAVARCPSINEEARKGPVNEVVSNSQVEELCSSAEEENESTGVPPIPPLSSPDEPAPAVSRATSVVRVAASVPVEVPRASSTSPRQTVDAPELAYAQQIEAPVMVQPKRLSYSGEGRHSNNTFAELGAILPQHSIGLPPLHGQGVLQRESLLPRLDSNSTTACYDENGEEEVSASVNGSKYVVEQPSAYSFSQANVSASVPPLPLSTASHHCTAPINASDVPVEPPATTAYAATNRQDSLVAAQRERVLPAGVSMVGVPQLRPRSRQALPHEQAPSRVAESTPLTLPALHNSSTSHPFSMSKVPATTRTPPSTPSSEGLPGPAAPVIQRHIAASSSAGVFPRMFSVSPSTSSQPASAASQSQRSLQSAPQSFTLKSKKWMDGASGAADERPSRLAASLSSTPSPPIPLQSRSPLQQKNWITSGKRADGSHAAVMKQRRPTFPLDGLSNGLTPFHQSRITPLSSGGATGEGISVSGIPPLHHPEQRSAHSLMVVVTEQPNDRFNGFLLSFSEMENALRSRYPRMERELMAAAHGVLPTTDAVRTE